MKPQQESVSLLSANSSLSEIYQIIYDLSNHGYPILHDPTGPAAAPSSRLTYAKT